MSAPIIWPSVACELPDAQPVAEFFPCRCRYAVFPCCLSFVLLFQSEYQTDNTGIRFFLIYYFMNVEVNFPRWNRRLTLLRKATQIMSTGFKLWNYSSTRVKYFQKFRNVTVKMIYSCIYCCTSLKLPFVTVWYLYCLTTHHRRTRETVKKDWLLSSCFGDNRTKHYWTYQTKITKLFRPIKNFNTGGLLRYSIVSLLHEVFVM